VIHNGSFLARGSGPDWSPDGRTIAVPVRLQSTPSRCVLDTISVADGRIRELYSSLVEYVNFGRPVWLPSGDLLLVSHFDSASRRTQLWTISFPDGVARRFTNDLADYDTGRSNSNSPLRRCALIGSIGNAFCLRAAAGRCSETSPRRPHRHYLLKSHAKTQR
jgi:hypothetical protein